MSDTPPKFWDEIRAKMQLDSFECIGKFRDILDFMGYKTLHSVAKLRQQRLLDRFEIAAAKLNDNVRFREKFKDTNVDMAHGDILVLKEIAAAAEACISIQTEDACSTIQKKIYERCKKVATQLVLGSVLVDLSGKPMCEVSCPFTNCGHVSKLGLLRQSDVLVLPKFNTFNFERHFQTQHVNRKRKPLGDISNIAFDDELQHRPDTPNTSRLEDEIKECHDKIHLLEQQNADLKQKQPQEHQQQQEQASISHDLENEIKELRSKVQELQNENSMLKHQQQLGNENRTALNRVVALEEENRKLQSIAHNLQYKNIYLRHEVMDVRKTVRAMCRIKPEAGQQCHQIEFDEDQKTLKLFSNDGKSIDQFHLDYVFGPDEKNKDVFNFITPLILAASDGFNICIIAFGASGSGKSHTLHGIDTEPGIVPNAIKLLTENRELKIHCSFYEIYNNKIADLLEGNGSQVDVGTNLGRVKNLKEVHIQSIDQFQEVFASANANRKVAATNRNNYSSRSHAAIQVRLNCVINNKNVESNLILFDMAGSENAVDHSDGSSKEKRSEEMSNINTSVVTFGTMVDSLKNGSFVDYRSSKLTLMLKPYFTTNFKTLIITTISQESKYYSVSKNSLSLAASAIKIKMN